MLADGQKLFDVEDKFAVVKRFAWTYFVDSKISGAVSKIFWSKFWMSKYRLVPEMF